jgi:hypothetical protein
MPKARKEEVHLQGLSLMSYLEPAIVIYLPFPVLSPIYIVDCQWSSQFDLSYR